jgi:multisubunit Na+/H+ antiporter MnhF subunit
MRLVLWMLAALNTVCFYSIVVGPKAEDRWGSGVQECVLRFR